jgi:hypothetical protein
MTREEQDDVRRPDKVETNVARADESSEKELNGPFVLRSVRKVKDDLTGRAYQYFNKLQ